MALWHYRLSRKVEVMDYEAIGFIAKWYDLILSLLVPGGVLVIIYYSIKKITGNEQENMVMNRKIKNTVWALITATCIKGLIELFKGYFS